jgi:uncharacterized protein
MAPDGRSRAGCSPAAVRMLRHTPFVTRTYVRVASTASRRPARCLPAAAPAIVRRVARPPREIRDPVHVFVHVTQNERRVLDSRPFQRLRNVHQLAMTYLVYPGASHKRFEHSLGVMHLAGMMFDIVTSEEKLTDPVREILPPEDELGYWRSVLKMAALCHDMGHLPFSHAAESELLPDGKSHEDITRSVIENEPMAKIWDEIRPPVKPADVVKLALGPKKARGVTFSVWEEILADLITGDMFGADRIDYLLRDSLHIGVEYGRFDHHRLIQTLKILPPPATPADPSAVGEGGVLDQSESSVFELGVERGGLESAEALQLARYFMFSQVYLHPVRMIYDIHLKDFLLDWVQAEHGGAYPTEVEAFLGVTDNEILAALLLAADDENAAGHEHASRIINREHFKVFYSRRPGDVALFAEAATAIFKAAEEEFGSDNVRYADGRKSGIPETFAVQDRDGQSVASTALSDAFERLLQPKDEFVYVAPELREKAQKWVEKNGPDIIQAAKRAEQEEAEEVKTHETSTEGGGAGGAG